MGGKRAFLVELPGDPNSDYLRAVLPLAPTLAEADGAVLPRLTGETAGTLVDALKLGKAAFLVAESLPDPLPRSLTAGLSALTRRGLMVCPLTQVAAWVQTGVSCPQLLTYERLKTLAAQGFDRIYLAARPGVTPLALRAAKTRNIQLTGGVCSGTGQGHRLGVVHPEK